jgi:hypothetical protein
MNERRRKPLRGFAVDSAIAGESVWFSKEASNAIREALLMWRWQSQKRSQRLVELCNQLGAGTIIAQ